MNSLIARTACALLVGAALISCSDSPTAVRPLASAPPAAHRDEIVTPPAVVISQIYGGGGNSGAKYTNDFIELFNPGATTVDLTGWSVQYASTAGTSWQVTKLSGSIAAGGYYLVQESKGSGGTDALPTPDVTGTISMSATSGKVAVAHTATALTVPSGSTCPAAGTFADLVSFGNSNCGDGAPGLSNTTAAIRGDHGCAYTGHPSADFIEDAPTPRNSATAPQVCANAVPHLSFTGAVAVSVGTPLSLRVAASSNGQPINISAATWTVDNTTVVGSLTVAADDPTTATAQTLAKGTATITVNATTDAGPLTGTATITVTNAPASVSLAPQPLIIKPGATAQLTPSAVDNDGSFAATTFTWSSDNATVADVDANGVVTGHAAGNTTIHVTTANGKTASAAVGVSLLTLDSRSGPIPAGFQDELFVGGTLGDGSPIGTVTWTSSKPSVLTVDALGVITALNGGSGTDSSLVKATASDGTIAAAYVVVESPLFSSSARSGHNEEFGRPTDSDASNDVIIARKEYTSSYNPQRGGANWVSWDLSASHLGSRERCNCYSADTALTRLGYTAYQTTDWVSGGQFDRGHMEPSADQTTTDTENGTTFFLSNFLPQRHALNAGVWEDLESAMRDSARAGREVYQIAGGIFTNGVGLGPINSDGHIIAPDSTWKIAVLLPAGKGLADVTNPNDIDVIAVNMPNVSSFPTGDKWTNYTTTVAKLEKSTGYNFLSLLPEAIQCKVEVRDCPPIPVISGTGVAGGLEGQTLSFSATSTTDPEGDAISYQWSVNGKVAGVNSTLDYTFPDNGTYQLSLIASDINGAAATTTIPVTIQNVAPTVTFTAVTPTTLQSGDPIATTGSFTDPGPDAAWQASIDWGNGTTTKPLPSTFNTSGEKMLGGTVYLAPGSFTATLSVTDKDGGVGTASIPVTVTRRVLRSDLNPDAIKLSNGDDNVDIIVYGDVLAHLSTIDASTVRIGSVGVNVKNGGYDTAVEAGGLRVRLRFSRQALVAAGLLSASTTNLDLTGSLSGGIQFVSHVAMTVK